MNNPVVHFEIGCKDLEETSRFYKEVFNWTTTPMGLSALIDTQSDQGVQGHFTALGHEPHQYVNIYIQTENLEEALQSISSHGGKTLVGPVDLPDGRAFAWFEDVAGNTVGLISTSDSG